MHTPEQIRALAEQLLPPARFERLLDAVEDTQRASKLRIWQIADLEPLAAAGAPVADVDTYLAVFGEAKPKRKSKATRERKPKWSPATPELAAQLDALGPYKAEPAPDGSDLWLTWKTAPGLNRWRVPFVLQFVVVPPEDRGELQPNTAMFRLYERFQAKQPTAVAAFDRFLADYADADVPTAVKGLKAAVVRVTRMDENDPEYRVVLSVGFEYRNTLDEHACAVTWDPEADTWEPEEAF